MSGVEAHRFGGARQKRLLYPQSSEIFHPTLDRKKYSSNYFKNKRNRERMEQMAEDAKRLPKVKPRLKGLREKIAGLGMMATLWNAPLAPNVIPTPHFGPPPVVPRSEIATYQPKPPLNLIAYYGETQENTQPAGVLDTMPTFLDNIRAYTGDTAKDNSAKKEGNSYNIADWFIKAARFEPNGETTGFTDGDDALFYEQVREMSYAHQDGAIISWDHIGDSRDVFLHRIKELSHRGDFPNPLFKWAIMYEKEAYGDPDPTQIDNDMNYLKEGVFNDNFYLKDEKGRPYVFVYCSDKDKAEYAKKWVKIAKLKNIHVVLKQFQFYDTTMIPVVGDKLEKIVNPAFKKVDWFNYEPLTSVQTTPNAFIISPGFGPKRGDWRVVRRDENRWWLSVTDMENSGKMLLIVLTYNEIEENTGMTSVDIEVLHVNIPPKPVVEDYNNTASSGSTLNSISGLH